MTSDYGEVTGLLKRMATGDKEASQELIPLVLDELRRLARHYLRNERLGHTLQPTALVNEAYLRLAGYADLDWQSRAHFIGVAASVMRQVLVDHARRRKAAKRGSGEGALPLEESDVLLSEQQSEVLFALNEALGQLERMNPRHSKIVEMRYFGGLTVEETAQALGISTMTVKRDWAVARAWLRGRIEGDGGKSA